MRHAREAEPARHAVRYEAARPDHLRQGPAPDAQHQLELETTVLRMAEAEAEPRVARRARLHVGDAPGVTAHEGRAIEAVDAEPPAGARQAAAEQAQGKLHGGHGRIGLGRPSRTRAGRRYTRRREPD